MFIAPDTFDPSQTLREWFAEQSASGAFAELEAELRPASMSKLVASFETDTHLATITVWGRGTVLFLVLRAQGAEVAKSEERMVTNQAALHDMLESCLSTVKQLHARRARRPTVGR